MEVQEALMQISEIRLQLARTETFRGYRALTIGFTGMLALCGAVLQAVLIPQPEHQFAAYLMLWCGAAAVGFAVSSLEMFIRCSRAASPLAARMTWMALEQFLPCMIAGAGVTLLLPRFAPESMWLLPGLWSVLFSLGVFASARLLPRPIFAVAVYYLLGGLACLVFAQGDAAFSPWSMVGTFGVGQMMMAGILYWSLERNHDAR